MNSGSSEVQHGRAAVSSVQALLLDNDEDWSKWTKNLLEEEGIDRVVLAQTAEEASRKIEEGAYQLVLVDRNLEEARLWRKRPRQGDEWLLNHLSTIGSNVVTAIVTAFPKQIINREELENRGVKIVVKNSEREIRELQGLAASAKSIAEHRLVEAQVARLAPGARAAEVFLEWLGTRSNKSKKVTWIGNRQFSFDDLAEEVRRGSALGEELLDVFIEEMRARLGLGR